MTMSDFHELRPMKAFTADLALLEAPRADLTDVACTSAEAMKHTYESVFGDGSDDDETLLEPAPAKRARFERKKASEQNGNVEEWNYLLAGMDLPPSVIPEHSYIPVDIDSGCISPDDGEATPKKEAQDSREFYGELQWCDEIVAKLEAQLAKGPEDEEERMILETEEMVGKVVQEYEQERAREKIMKRKNREAKKVLSRVNKETKLFCCFICNKGFFCEQLVQEHINEVHLRNSKRFPHKCTSCHMRFAHMSNMYRHQATHKRDIFKCKECPYEFKTAMGLEIHVSRVHSVDFELACGSCNATYNHEDELKRHEYYCKNKEKILLKRKQAKAAVVGPQAAVSPAMSTYSASSSISTCSTSSAGRPTKDKSCPYCLDVFASMQSRDRHIGRKHPDQKDSAETANHVYFKVDSPDLPFACLDCGKRFASSASMNTHKKRIHEKKLDHTCHMCTKAYPLGSELRKHLRRVHNMAEVDAQDLTTF